MAITGAGWELQIVRSSEQTRQSDGRIRTVGSYQVFHDGAARPNPDLSGTVAETRGPGDNAHAGNNRRVEAGRYPIATQDGTKYVTIGYRNTESGAAIPKPGIELRNTGHRAEILLHPGRGYLSSIGCINPCTSLPNAEEMIGFVGSRRRVIAIIDDLRAYLGNRFPSYNGKLIPNAAIVIEGEP